MPRAPAWDDILYTCLTNIVFLSKFSSSCTYVTVGAHLVLLTRWIYLCDEYIRILSIVLSRVIYTWVYPLLYRTPWASRKPTPIKMLPQSRCCPDQIWGIILYFHIIILDRGTNISDWSRFLNARKSQMKTYYWYYNWFYLHKINHRYSI